MNIHPLTFVILGIACFRLTHLLVAEENTTFLRSPLVDAVNEPDAAGRWIKLQYPKPSRLRGFLGALISCPWCTGIWVSTAFVVGWGLFPHVVFPIAVVFAVAGLGIFLEMATQYWSRNSFSPTPKQVARINTINNLLTQTTPGQRTDERDQGRIL